MPSNHHSQITNHESNGFALPLALGMALIVTVIILALSDSSSHRLSLAADLDDRAGAEMTGYSAFNRILFTLLTARFTPASAIPIQADPAPQTPDTFPFFQHEPPASSVQWPLYGRPFSPSFPDSSVYPERYQVTVRLRDVAGLVSPLGDQRLLAALLDAVLEDRDRVHQVLDSLADWQDEDDFRRLHGAESWDYRAAGLDYVPRNAPVQSLEELELIMGVDRDLLNLLGDDLTYFPAGHINHLVMSDRLLRAVIPDADTADLVLALRRDGVLTPRDFTALTGIAADSEDFLFHTSFRYVLEIEVRDKSPGARAGEHIQVVINLAETRECPYQILHWQR